MGWFGKFMEEGTMELHEGDFWMGLPDSTTLLMSKPHPAPLPTKPRSQDHTDALHDSTVPYTLITIYMIDYMGRREEWKPIFLMTHSDVESNRDGSRFWFHLSTNDSSFWYCRKIFAHRPNSSFWASKHMADLHFQYHETSSGWWVVNITLLGHTI